MDSCEFMVVFLTKRMRDNDWESSSSSDDMWEAALSVRGQRQLRPRIIGYNDVVACYTDHEFKSHFRMSRATFQYLHGMMQKDLLRKVKGCPCIPSQTQLMIALWKMATADSYRSVCDRFNVGRATAVRAVRRVTRALFKRAPFGFPKIIGAIDGTHIRINATKEDQRAYVNRKGYHSIHLQLVCDHRCLITNCYAGHPGSIHDQRVFRISEVSEFLNDEQKFPSDSHLVGDAAYELQQHLMTPFRDNGFLTRETGKLQLSTFRSQDSRGKMYWPTKRTVTVLPQKVNENQENNNVRQVANQNAAIQKRIRIMENLP
ncbi:unnamed protein product [Euphydryas editha]|uniref:DDE Tnp4 domain-containing protein n=1 Tax=Euphydryas editha TaxID=104508 RepID=A0AAU9TS91_EUPED|nr:unnamed protein product [Euphydryas editha]